MPRTPSTKNVHNLMQQPRPDAVSTPVGVAGTGKIPEGTSEQGAWRGGGGKSEGYINRRLSPSSLVIVLLHCYLFATV